MATPSAGLPPIGKVFLVGIWVETVLYGVNCVTYGLCMFVLLRQGKVPPVRMVLVVMATTLFLLSTVHVGASLRQMLDAFVYAPVNVPDYSTTYWLDFNTTPRVLKNNTYVSLLLFQYFILIWRLYVVFMSDWRVVLFPIVLATGCVGCGYAASAVPSLPDDGIYGSVPISLIISACTLGITLNISVMVAIVARLWWMRRTIATLTHFTPNRYASSIYIVVESGCIYAICGAVVVALFVSSSPAAFVGLDVISQIAAWVPLSVVVMAGHFDRCRAINDDFSRGMFTLQGEIFQVGIL